MDNFVVASSSPSPFPIVGRTAPAAGKLPWWTGRIEGATVDEAMLRRAFESMKLDGVLWCMYGKHGRWGKKNEGEILPYPYCSALRLHVMHDEMGVLDVLPGGEVRWVLHRFYRNPGAMMAWLRQVLSLPAAAKLVEVDPGL